jgi:hypothetical protein
MLSCQKCRSPIACGGFDFCRDLNHVTRGNQVLWNGEKVRVIFTYPFGTEDHKVAWMKVMRNLRTEGVSFHCVEFKQLLPVVE